MELDIKSGLPEFAKALRARRKLCGFNQTKLSYEVGVSMKTLNNLEYARNWPSLPLYFALVRALKLEPAPLQQKAPDAK